MPEKRKAAIHANGSGLERLGRQGPVLAFYSFTGQAYSPEHTVQTLERPVILS